MNASNQVEIPAAQFFAALDAMAEPVKPALPTFSVTLHYRKGPSFGAQVIKAADAQSAITLARRFAAQCGMGGAERKPTVYEVQA